MGGEHSFQVRVRRDDGSTRILLTSEIVDRASDCSRQFFFHTFRLERPSCRPAAASDHDPDTAEHEEPAHREGKRPLEVRRPRGDRPGGSGSASLSLALLPPLSEQVLSPLAKVPVCDRPGADPGEHGHEHEDGAVVPQPV
jgi:hypothetical protein